MMEYTTLNWLFFNIVWLSLGELAIQTVISDLSSTVKGAMLLNQPYNTKLNLLCTYSFCKKLLGRGWWVATPFIFLFRLHRFFSEMLSCPWCCGFHFAWITNWLYLDMDIITSLILAPVVLVYVTILDRLHSR